MGIPIVFMTTSGGIPMFTQRRKATLLLTGICMLLVTTVAFGKASAEAAEAASVTVSWTDPGHDGVVQVVGCVQCPLSLSVNEKTSIKNAKTKLKPRETGSFSGKPGTVIYDKEKNLALKIKW